ncbi:MAG: metal-dependent hydrolase [Betaproteobacteria bacterium CG2_30_59_46]|nr:MAG: metal-dependent hydrolase [Betaproteobacteria bacterium CG2_30_59_46]PIQ12423.1 MAG: metal-dependent hydrolase [Hydrogenophilales bacterium CG18_big_fil_WC_8_21_14_2_50_58_12]PIX99443.1 MAG: metal-dependent hydrolase [Hydrogenophilales bacterium CG_4_10_14_3_um_filter_58_23]PJB08388.1 MAG: metal-dependent hydrolase [Hydrogenophilales bacterium CG_4_9_14_3_um_filter_59_35]
MIGLWTLLYKELLRFWKVGMQTILSPLVTTLLYLLIFSHVMAAHVQVYPGVGYTAFLIPGLVMMAMLQNAFANSSSSLIQSKMSGNIVFLLLPPLAYWQFFTAYVAAAIVRGLVVGLGVGLAGLWFTPVALAHPLWMVAFALAGCAMLGTLGIITALWADSYDQMATVQNFIILPLTFLSGVFYSIHSLPAFWQALSRYNPFFYLIDGFRYGFFGVSDVSPDLGLLIVGTCFLALSLATLALLKSGYKLRN